MKAHVLESCCPSQRAALKELERLAPNAPFLALGQTVFWDEPLKIGVKILADGLGYSRKFIAGVHDTDYFAKLHKPSAGNEFVVLPHNDTTTKSLWSAAGEFSTLFGSETVITRNALQRAGVRVHKIETSEPSLLDEATEAFGWRGVVSTSPEPIVAGQVPLGPVFPVMNATLNWALDSTLSRLVEPSSSSLEAAEELRLVVCDASEPRESQSLGDYYSKLLPSLHQMLSPDGLPCEVSRTSELLKFNSSTCQLPRFRIVEIFLKFSSRKRASDAYNSAVAASEIYPIERFGTGAIPFDLVVPGRGRGTIRIGTRGIVINTPNPVCISFKKPLESIEELAQVIEAKLGPNCSLVGKAVTLITMLSREFVFVFHEGGSGYVKLCRNFHDSLLQNDIRVDAMPILRVRYSPWDALAVVDCNIKLPDEMVDAFGIRTLRATEFATQHQVVNGRCGEMISLLTSLHKPIETLRYFESINPSWCHDRIAYEESVVALEGMTDKIAEIKNEKAEAAKRWRAAKKYRVEREVEKGKHWREKLFEKEASLADWEFRKKLQTEVELAIENVRIAKQQWRELDEQQLQVVNSEKIKQAKQTRREIELRSEKFRLKLVRGAVISREGLQKSGLRPSAWWFPVISPDGSWFKATIEHAQWYLEHLCPPRERDS